MRKCKLFLLLDRTALQLTILVILLCTIKNSIAQTSPVIESIIKTNINYESFIINNDKLFAINDSGDLVIWNLNTLDTIFFAHNDSAFSYTSIAEDRNHQLYLGTNKGKIFKLNPSDLSYRFYIKSKYYPIYGINFNRKNELFLVIPYAVYDPVNNKAWHKFDNHSLGLRYYKKVFGLFKKRIYYFFNLPHYTFTDSNENWWMCSGQGEWGGQYKFLILMKKK